MKYFRLAFATGLLFCLSCQSVQKTKIDLNDQPDYLRNAQGKLTQVIVHDIFSPPVASRIYAYTSIAAYEGIALQFPEYKSFAGQLNGLNEVPQPVQGKEYDFPIVSLASFYHTARSLVFSVEEIDKHKEETFNTLKKFTSKDVFERSVKLGEDIGKHIMAWASKDNYHQTRSFEKYNYKEDPATWKPTPPAYMEGIEPHWTKIRPFALDSSSQFIPERPTVFDTDNKSKFFEEAMYVYNVKRNLTDEQRNIASFWDCNPYVVNVVGHVMFATKKITPGGHWMEIACIASKTAKASWIKTTEALAMTAVALADGFISCWDEKYRSIVIRPETFINEYIDEDWEPLLQTPPFPEYTSGHSVISNAAAAALTSIFGDSFHFVDSSEVSYGLPIREFDSFQQAADEAAVSRLYGGIHYMPAIENGVAQGKKVGQWVVKKIKLKDKPSTDLIAKAEINP